jgi:membrane-bound lytic murein transglycosylase D
MRVVKSVIFSVFLLLFVFLANNSYSITNYFSRIPDDTVKISSKEFQANLDSLLNNFFVSQSLKVNLNSLYPAQNMDKDVIPQFSDSVYIQRLQSLPSIIDMTYNDKVRAFIELYVNKKRKNVKVMLGLSEYYFPIFEEILDKQGLPQELKYLTIIESALNPRATSRVGASGLWQFMYTTGKIYDLQVNSLVDERRDPIKASYAAANYLKDLYGIYKDWTLAIAAYNCGPGNVNKAIKRSKGKTNFWEIYDYLPAETRGYVPAFIAANYMMNYYKEHNLFPQKIDFPTLTDTVMVDADINLKDVSEALDLPLQQLRDMNPQYKNDIIPGNSESYSLKLPVNLVTTFIEMEDSISLKSKESMIKYTEIAPHKNYLQISPNDEIIRVTHKVKSGDNLNNIAKKYGVDVAALKEWNRIKSKKLKGGQKLIIYTTKKSKTSDNEKSTNSAVKTKNDEPKIDTIKHEVKKTEKSSKEIKDENPAKKNKKTASKKNPEKSTHKVQKGETLSSISRKYNVSINDLIDWNNLKKDGKINIGQSLLIKSK